MTATKNYFQPEVLNKISRLELRARQVVEGFLSGLHQSPYKGFSVEFADHRPYVAGDDVRHIDWRLYAKADRFYIKQYEVETNLRTWLLLDCSGSMGYPEHGGDGRMTKWDYACTIAASLAYLLIQQGDGAGLMLFDQAVRGQLPANSSEVHLHRMVDAIERTVPGDQTDAGTVLRHLSERLPHRSMVVIISDLLADEDAIISGLERLRFSQHEVLMLHVLDADELEFSFTDRTLFEGIEEAGLEVLTDPQSLRSAYLEGVNAFINRMRGWCLNNRSDYALVSTADPLDVVLTRFLANRMRRARRRA